MMRDAPRLCALIATVPACCAWAQQLSPTTSVASPRDVGSGILGKWKYIPYFYVFIGLMGG
jgi:hypothetical protein